jgi:hypothetical protein
MYKRVLVIAAVGVALGAAWMQAKRADAAAAARLNATIVSSTVPSASPSACASTGFAAICPSVTGCQCVKITGATLTGNFGKGTADLLITEDPISATSSGSSGSANNCVPFFGTATLTGTKGVGAKAKTQTGNVNIVGADCDAFTANLPETISGGFGIAVPSPSPAMTGWGNLKGTVNSKGVFRVNLTGPMS